VKSQFPVAAPNSSHPSYSSLQAGHAALTVEFVAGQSTVTSAIATSPMKLLTPRSRGASVWAYTSSFGGGLVAGDQTELDVCIASGARCFLGTQASTKVYRNSALRACSHVTRARLEPGSLLVFAPDPVQPFAGSTYSQLQEFHVAPDAGLVLVDWFSSGRAARGERWTFNRFRSRNEVFVQDERVFLDSLVLDSTDSNLASSHRTGRFNCFALLLVLGPPLKGAAKRFLEAVSARSVEHRTALVTSASRIRDGALLRMAGTSVEEVGRELQQHLTGVCDLLGDDPWARKW
jgi:urease accessory protein